MNKFILVLMSTVLLLSCASKPEKVDIVGQINQDIKINPSAVGGTGINYYVCDDGDDANDGLSEAAPWKTFAKGIGKFKKMEAGDAVLFCRGGVFITTKTEKIANFKCQASNPCIISDYYNPVSQVADVPPVIISQHTSEVFNFQDSGRADHDEGYLLENFNLKGPGVDQGEGFFFYNDVDDVRLQNITISSFKVGINIGGSNKPSPGSDSYNERITGNNVFADNLNSFVVGIGKEDFLAKLVIDIIEEPAVVIDAPVLVVNEPVVVIEEPAVVIDAPVLVVNEPVVVIEEPIITSIDGTYFVCDTGSDDNDGLSPDTPWLTYAKAMGQFNSLQAGESINFCRGGVFYVELTPRLANFNCTAGNKCQVSDYYASVDSGSAALERPKIISLMGEVLFKFEESGNADQDGGYLIENLILEGSVAKDAAIYLFNDVDDLTVSNVKMDGFKYGISLMGSNALNEGSNGQNDRIIFENNQVVNNSGQGWLGGCSDCMIRSNYFENNGFANAVGNHNFYFSAHNDVNILITDNTFKKSTHVDGRCDGVAVVMHGVGKNITIENNLIDESLNNPTSSCWGLSVDPGYSFEESFEHLVIRGNTVMNTGYLGIGCASCVDVLIENNIIINEGDMFFEGVSVPNRNEDTVKSSGIIVRNNEVVLSLSSIYKSKQGFKIGPKDGSFTINNNTVRTNYKLAVCATVTGGIVATADQCVIVNN